jgi:hypothetical protein
MSSCERRRAERGLVSTLRRDRNVGVTGGIVGAGIELELVGSLESRVVMRTGLTSCPLRTQFTSFTGIKVQILTQGWERKSHVTAQVVDSLILVIKGLTLPSQKKNFLTNPKNQPHARTVKPSRKSLRILCRAFIRKICGLLLSTRLEDILPRIRCHQEMGD